MLHFFANLKHLFLHDLHLTDEYQVFRKPINPRGNCKSVFTLNSKCTLYAGDRQAWEQLHKLIINAVAKGKIFLTDFIVLGGRLQFDFDDPAFGSFLGRSLDITILHIDVI